MKILCSLWASATWKSVAHTELLLVIGHRASSVTGRYFLFFFKTYWRDTICSHMTLQLISMTMKEVKLMKFFWISLFFNTIAQNFLHFQIWKMYFWNSYISLPLLCLLGELWIDMTASMVWIVNEDTCPAGSYVIKTYWKCEIIRTQIQMTNMLWSYCSWKQRTFNNLI